MGYNTDEIYRIYYIQVFKEFWIRTDVTSLEVFSDDYSIIRCIQTQSKVLHIYEQFY